MRSIIYLIIFVFVISCDPPKNCDLSTYPSAPYGIADDSYYTDTSVRYLYTCYSGSYNKIVTFEIVDACWEMFVDEEYNFNCN